MKSLLISLLLMTAIASNSFGDDVRIKKVIFKQETKGLWTVSVTVSHQDEGWKHYADQWRVVNSENGKVLGARILAHPHVDEQPFTRSLSNIPIPEGVTDVYIEGHDTIHGWSPHKVKIDMSKNKGRRYEIIR